MWEETMNVVGKDLTLLTKQSIPISRALDLMEASTKDIRRIVAINTLRESLLEINTQ